MARRSTEACPGPGRDLDGRRAVVTAATGGVGRALVSRLLAAGVAVIAVDPDADRLRAEFGDRCALVVGDLARDGAALADEVLATQGPVDLIVCNFGPGDRTGVLDLDEPGFDTAFGIRGPLFFVQRLVRGLLGGGRQRGDRWPSRSAGNDGDGANAGRHPATGSVLFLADAGDVPARGAWEPRNEQACAELTAMLAAPLDRHGIRVNAIAPGWGGRGPGPGQQPTVGLLGRPGRPEDVANLAACLLSEGCTGSTGGRFSLTRRPAHWAPVGQPA